MDFQGLRQWHLSRHLLFGDAQGLNPGPPVCQADDLLWAPPFISTRDLNLIFLAVQIKLFLKGVGGGSCSTEVVLKRKPESFWQIPTG